MTRKRKKLADDDQSGDENPPSKKVNLFSASVFRRDIRGDEAVTALKSFVHLCKSSEDRNVVLEYFEAGGGALELVALIQANNNKNTALVELVFSALRFIIASTLKDVQRYRQSTEDACKQVLNHHLATLHDMLSMTSTSKHKKIVLELLAAMVTLSTQIAKMILGHIKIAPFSWPMLLRHTKPINKSVRTSFIYYLMAFLFDGSTSVILSLLETKGLLTSIIPGLMFDAADTVHLVLTTLQNKVLMNMNVSKTHKLHTFYTQIIKSLVMLYNWKGPAKWKPLKKSRDDVHIADEDDDAEKERDKQFVVNDIHEFLKVLCASHKYGIIFHDKSIGTSGKKHNELLQTVLESLEKPWEHEKPGELVLKIVTACPDLLKCVLKNMEPYLEPRVSINWLKIIHFAKQIIESMNAELNLKQYADNLSVKQVTEVVRLFTMPNTFLRAIGSGMLQHRQMLVRHEAVNLLIAMLKQFYNFLTAIEQWNLVDSTVIKGFKLKIMKQLPKPDLLLSLWNMIHSLPEESNNEGEDKRQLSVIDEPSVRSHMLLVVDLLIIYNEGFPQVLDIPDSINFLADIENGAESEDDQEVVTLLQERILHLLMNVDSNAFTPDKEMFSDALHRLSRLVDYPSTKLQIQARNLLGTVLMNTGLFEGVISEVCVWLHCCLAVPTDHRDSVIKLIVDAVVRVNHCPAMYLDLITQSEDDTKQVLGSSRLDSILDELLEMSDDEDKPQDVNPALPAATVALSPLLPAVIEVVASLNDTDQLENVRYFISCVVIHLLHSQTSPSVLLGLLERWPEILPSAVTSYIKGWTSDEQLQPLKKPFGSHSPESKISKALLKPDGTSVHHILGLDDENKILTPEKKSTLNKELYLSDPIRVLLLYKLSVFHMVQLASRGELTVELRDKCKDALLSLLQVVSNIDSNQDSEMNFAFSKHQEHLMLHCLKHTFTNPRLIQLFTPLHRKKQIIEKLTTEIVLELIKLSCLSKNDMVSVRGFLNPFKQKLIQHIMKRLKKQDHSKVSSLNAQNVISMVDLFELSYSDVTRLMDHIVVLPETALISESDDCASLSVWGNLLGLLLGRCRTLHKPIKTTMAVNITKMVMQLTKVEKIDLLVLEEQFLLYLELFPHHLEHIPGTRLVHALLMQKEPSKYAVKLVELLLKRKTVLVHDFISLTRKNKNLRENASVLFPVMCIALASEMKIDDKLLSKLYNVYSEQIQTAILEPSKAVVSFRDFPSVVITLVDKGMEFGTCKEILEKVKRKVAKLPKYEEFYVDVVKCITTIVSKKEPIHTNIVLLLLEMLTSLPKENGLDEKQMSRLCRELQDCAVHNKDGFVAVSSSDVWPSFFKMALKFGLQPYQDEGGMLLETLSKLCDAVYEDNVKEPQVKKIFEWTSSHSEFLTIMLGHAQKKVKLVELLLILVKKDPSVMLNQHVPIFLSSYNASLDVTDQLVLQLLNMYEAGGMNLHDYRPYLWGDAAINHYSVKSKVGMSLWRQPQAGQVLELLDKRSVKSTIKNFPLDRGLEPYQLATPQSKFRIYDPAFLLPLFNHLLAPEVVINAKFFISCGGLALTLAALGSNCEDTRAAAYQVLARMYFHVEAIRAIKARLLYLQFLDAVRSGVIALNKPANTQLPCVVTTFLARASLVLSETHDTMYIPLQRFMVAKPTLDMTVVPEFFTFFHSSEIDYRTHRKWILQVIRDGLRSKMDFQVCQRCAVFKLLMTFYTSVLADDETKGLILKVVESTVKIPFAAGILVCQNGLISWLHWTIGQLSQDDDSTLVTTVINILTSLWTTLTKSSKEGDKKKSSVVNHLPHHTLLLMLELLPKLGSLLSVSDLKQYLCTVEAVLSYEHSKAVCGLINIAQMSELVQLSKVILGSVLDCEDLLEYGCKFAVGKSQDAVSGDESEQARFYLRKLVLNWLVRMHSEQPPR